jgi:hypothetical protein
MPIPVRDQFTEEQKTKVAEMWNHGKTQKEIAEVFGVPRRTMGKLCDFLGLERSVSEVGKITHKSDLDNNETIEKIKSLRLTKSLDEIAKILESSSSSVNRICKKHNITIPSNYSELQSMRIKNAWTDEKKAKISQQIKETMKDETIREKIAASSKKSWKDPVYVEKQLKQKEKWSQEMRRRYSEKMMKVIELHPEIREKLSKASKLTWGNPEYTAKMAEIRAQQPKVSSLQKVLYSILDDLKIKYYREREDGNDDPQCIIGPYNVDCVIPRDGKPDLIVECQGDYWHTLDRSMRVDRAKSTYISTYYGDKYEIKYLWEHEFKCYEKIYELVKYWMDLTQVDVVEFKFDDMIIKPCQAVDYRELLSKYHYLSNAGKGGKAFGAYLGEELAAVCVFSPLPRQNIEIEGFTQEEVRELSRLCIHPKYQIKNFASWFVSRCIKMLDEQFKCIISYCDTTFNHNGAIYKALNFKQDSVVRPDYWYTSEDGWAMHKKTLYKHAVQMSMTEGAYAEKFGYKKVYGKEKLRFIFVRPTSMPHDHAAIVASHEASVAERMKERMDDFEKQQRFAKIAHEPV